MNVAQISWHLSYGSWKTLEKTSTRKLTQPGIKPGPAVWEVTTLPLDHSSGRQWCKSHRMPLAIPVLLIVWMEQSIAWWISVPFINSRTERHVCSGVDDGHHLSWKLYFSPFIITLYCSHAHRLPRYSSHIHHVSICQQRDTILILGSLLKN